MEKVSKEIMLDGKPVALSVMTNNIIDAICRDSKSETKESILQSIFANISTGSDGKPRALSKVKYNGRNLHFYVYDYPTHKLVMYDND